MRAKQQSTTQLTQSSLAMTILPSAASSRGRKSRAAETPEADVAPTPSPPPVATPAPLQPPIEFAGAPAAAAPAPVWSPPAPTVTAPVWSPPAAPAAPVWSPPAPTATASGWSPAPPAAPVWAPRVTSAPTQFGGTPAADFPLNYPAAPGFPPQPHYADGPGVDYLPPPAAPEHWVPQHAAPHHGATQPAPPAYGPPPFGAPGYAGFPPPAPAPSGSKARIGVIVAVCVVLVIGISYALVRPTFSVQHKPANRNIVLPAMLLEQQKVTDDPSLSANATAQVASMQQDLTGITQAQAAYYGQADQPLFAVTAAKLPEQPTSADRQAFFKATGTRNQMTLTSEGSGPFGGSMECGAGTANGTAVTMCVSLDSAAVIVVISSGTSPGDLATLTRQVIGAVEQKG